MFHVLFNRFFSSAFVALVCQRFRFRHSMRLGVVCLLAQLAGPWAALVEAQTIADVYNELVEQKEDYLYTIRESTYGVYLELLGQHTNFDNIATYSSLIEDHTLGTQNYLTAFLDRFGYGGSENTLENDMATLITSGLVLDFAPLFDALGYDGDPVNMKTDLNAMNTNLSLIYGAVNPSTIGSMASNLNAIKADIGTSKGYLLSVRDQTDDLESLLSSIAGSSAIVASGLGYDGDPATLRSDMLSLIASVDAISGDPGDLTDPGLPSHYAPGPLPATFVEDTYADAFDEGPALGIGSEQFSSREQMDAPVIVLDFGSWLSGMGLGEFPSLTVDFSIYGDTLRPGVRVVAFVMAGLLGLSMVWEELRRY